MMRALLAAAALVATLIAAIGGAGAEQLVVSLSTHRVLITSSFAGTDLVLFGSVERDAATVARRGGYDIVVTVMGPRRTVVTRRKDRVLGIWVNVDSRTYPDTPTYLAVLSNRPTDQIATANVLRRFKVGLGPTFEPEGATGDEADDPFRAALLRLNVAHGLYREQGNAVTFLTPNLFRTAIALPANVPIGGYEVDVKLFADGAMLARQTTAIEIVKVGFEQFVAVAANDHGLFYGFAAAGLALLTGWLASVVFRRD
jgi:uncharacterized protein (TIGR02186 family)